MATTVDSILVKIDADMGDLRTELRRLDKQLSNSSKKIKKDVGAISGAFKLIGPAVAAALATTAVRSIISTAVEVENLQIQLGYLFGSVEEGARAFDVMAEFASRVPFSLQEIQQASAPLGAVAKDANELATLLKLTGDVAAVTGLGFQETSLQIQRAFSAGIGAADQFRDRGVSAMLGFEQGVSYTAQETIAKFDEAFGEGGQFEGASGALANTFSGTMSMLGDSLFNFKKQVGEAGFFDALKEEVQSFDKSIKANEETVQAFAENLSAFLTIAMKEVIGFVFAAINAFNELMDFFRGVTHAFEQMDLIDFLMMTVDEAVEVGAKLREDQRKTAEDVLDNGKKIKDGAEIASEGLGGLSAASSGASKDFDKLEEKLGKISAKLAETAIGITPEGDSGEGAFASFIAGAKLTGEEIEYLRGQFVGLAEAEEHLSKFEKAKKLLEEKDATEKLAEQIQALTEYQNAFGDSTGRVQEKIDELNQELDEQDPKLKILIDAYDRAGDRIAGALADAFTEGKLSMESFADISRMLVNEIIKEFIKLTIITPIMDSIKSAMSFGGSSGGGGGGGGKTSAGGGMMHPSMPTLVGERGPELFVPHSAGTLMNNMNTQNALGGGSPITVNQSLNFAVGVSDTVKAEVMNMMPVINQNAVQAVQTARQRGGSIADTFGT